MDGSSTWTLVARIFHSSPKQNRRIVVDGALIDQFHPLVHGHWEAKDTRDDLEKLKSNRKFQDGYPRDNILFQDSQYVRYYGRTEFKYLMSILTDQLHVTDRYPPGLLCLPYHKRSSKWEEAVATVQGQSTGHRGWAVEINQGAATFTNRLFDASPLRNFSISVGCQSTRNLSEAAVEEIANSASFNRANFQNRLQ